MIVANIKSAKDLSDKKNLQNQLLELEIANEAETQKRRQEKGVKDLEVKKLPEQYKTTSELYRDRANLEKKALDNFVELGFNYSESGQLVSWVSNEGRLGDFNARFKEIKKDIVEKYDPKLINDQFIRNYLTNYFDDLDVNLGKKFGKESANESILDLYGVKEQYPSFELIEGIADNLFKILALNRALSDIKSRKIQKPNPAQKFISSPYSDYYPLSNSIESKIALAIDLLNKYQSIIPTRSFLNDAVAALSQNERMNLAKTLERAFRLTKVPTRLELLEIGLPIETFLNNIGDAQLTGEYPDPKRLTSVIDRLIRQLSSVGDDKTGNAFINFYNDYDKAINSTNSYEKLGDELSKKQALISQAYKKDIGDILRERGLGEMIDKYSVSGIGKDSELDISQKIEEANYLYNQETEAYSEAVKSRKAQKEYEILVEKEKKAAEAFLQKKIGIQDYLNELFQQAVTLENSGLFALARLITSKFYIPILKKGEKQPYLSINDLIILNNIIRKKTAITNEEKNEIGVILEETVNKYLEKNPEYDPRINQKGFKIYTPRGAPNGIPVNTPAGVFGLGSKPKFLSKLKKHFKEDEQLLNKLVKTVNSSSESEEEEELNRHIKVTKGKDKDLERFVTGVSFKAKRIPVGKVGKGVKLEKEDNPTYRQFGKYVLHIPYLLNSNVANFKYPSLGSIPSIKPLTISDDYKDLILDVLQTGKLNKKELERLPQNEIKHFEKVAVGAGLVEQLGMKVGSTEEDKADAKRFEVLRGEYLAGNNNEKMIKELRLLITKFINNGRIHKNEGLNLLLELSTI